MKVYFNNLPYKLKPDAVCSANAPLPWTPQNNIIHEHNSYM